jgi:hypothetical protein
MLVTGRAGGVTRAAADRVVHLLGEGVIDVGILMEALEPLPRPADGLTWLGPMSFTRQVAQHTGVDHDLGNRWGARRDIRISHRVTEGATVGLLYAYDRTWDEYAILDPAADVEAVARTFHAALATSPHLPVADFVALLRQHARAVVAQPDPSRAQL